MGEIPAQRRSCAVHAWCTVPGRGHDLHAGRMYALASARGNEVRLVMTADGAEEPRVRVEVAYGPLGPGMEVAEMDAAEALELAGVLLRMAREANAGHNAER